MIGYLLLAIALYLYTKPQYKYISIILYIGFCLGSLGGYNILTNDVVGVKNKDLASVYTIAIVIYELLTHGLSFPRHAVLRKIIRFYKFFLLFLCMSVIFSLTYYDFTFFEVLQGGRDLVCILSLLIVFKLSYNEIDRILRFIFYINFFTAIIYILQVIIGSNILPYPYGINFDSATGLVRLYNFPVNLYLCLFMSFFANSYLGIKKVNAYRFVFIGALICTQGRTMIIVGVLGILIGILLSRKNSATIRNVIMLLIILIPVLNMVSERSKSNQGESDWDVIRKGGYKDFDSTQGDATMAYRFAWIYERAEYLSKRSLSENIFGLGLISDSQKKVKKMYNFSVGLRDPEDGSIIQLNTPDTSYGQMLCLYGYGGSLIVLLFLLYTLFVFYKYRTTHPIVLCSFIFLFCEFINSFSGNQLALPRNYVVIFVLLSFLIKNQNFLENRYIYENGKE